MRIRINPYNPGSRSAGALAQYLTQLHGRAVLRLRRDTQFRPREGDVIINYGIGHADVQADLTVNPANAVRRATNKLYFFQKAAHQEYRTPEWSTDIEQARAWIRSGHKVCCRTNLAGHSADGLVLARTEEQVVQAPLYTKYVSKQQEYRVHFVGDTVVDVQRKARRADVPDEDVNWQVRNHDNGFIYARGNVTPRTVPEDVIRQCEEYIQSTNLDFGSIDVIYKERREQAYILEVNTASGLEGTTLERIGDALYAYVRGEQVQPWDTLPVHAEEAREEAPAEPEVQAQPPEEVVDVDVQAERLQRQRIEADMQRFRQLLENYRQANQAREEALRNWNDAQREMFNGNVIGDATRQDALLRVEGELQQRLQGHGLDRQARRNIRAEAPQQNAAEQELRVML